MQEIIDQILDYLRGIWRQRWYALAVVWAICIAGWITVRNLPDQYEAYSKVHVDTVSLLRALLKDVTYTPNQFRQVRELQNKILTRPNIEKIIREADLDHTVKDDAGFEGLVNEVSSKLLFTQVGRETIFTIQYVDPNPQIAKSVVQSLLDLLMETAIGDNRNQSKTALSFLDDQIEEYERRLVEAETKLTEFKQKNIGLMPEQGRDYYERLQAEMGAVKFAELELRQAVNSAESLRRQLSGEQPAFGLSGTGPTDIGDPEIHARITTLNKTLDELLLRYTEKHPDVINTQNLIADLEARQDEQRKANAAAGFTSGSSLGTNPVYQQLKISYGQAQAQVASLRAKVSGLRARAEELQKLVNVLPKIEEQLKGLSRDYALNKEKHRDLLEKREEVRLSRQRDQATGNIQFEVLESPRVTPEPVGPNRPLLAGGVMLIALAAGLGLSFLISQIRGDFDNAKTLSRVLELPVFGRVSVVMDKKAQRKTVTHNAIFVALLFALIPLYGFFMWKYMPLNALLAGG